MDGPVLAADFHLEDFVGVLPALDPGMGHESDEAFLKSAETAFDLAFGLGSRRDEMGDAKPKQGALELALRIAMVVTGTWAEETQAVGINGFWQSMGFEGTAEVAEVVPGGVGRHETTGDVEAGMIINGEQQDLFSGCGPPLMDGTVVLIEFANSGTAEAPVDAGLSDRSGNEMRKVCFDINLDAGPSPLETAEPLQFIRHELIVGRVLQWQKVFEEGAD